MKIIAKVLLLLTIVGLVMSCTYGHKNYSQDGGLFKESIDFVIQVDDFGAFWDPEVPDRALKAIQSVSAKTNTIVILFVHGWHHNADIDDCNAKDFAKTLFQIRKKLEDMHNGVPGPYRMSRERLTGDGNVNVIGLYIGWRGKSLPMPLDYMTFWGRKAVAEQVGQGDLREFLHRLNAIYKDRNATNLASHKVPFMGMVAIGHSFGGQVLFSAVVSSLEEELIQATLLHSINGEKSQTNHLSGFGDMVVLVNPAIEALQYDRIDTLSQRLNYDRRQTPLLMVLSSETDFARQFFFPLGRWVDTLYRPSFRDGQKELWTQALGEYEPQRTHTVEIIRQDASLEPWFDPKMYTDAPCDIVNLDLAEVPLVNLDLTEDPLIAMKLTPTIDRHAYNPFIVAYADSKVVIKHSGIFKKALRDFLNDYIAIVEGKRILLRDPKILDCPRSDQR